MNPEIRFCSNANLCQVLIDAASCLIDIIRVSGLVVFHLLQTRGVQQSAPIGWLYKCALIFT